MLVLYQDRFFFYKWQILLSNSGEINMSEMQMFVNAISIASEVYGFILMLKSTKTLTLKRGSFLADKYVDPKTGKPPPTAQSAPLPQIINTGIGFVIAGLIGQILAIFL